MHMNKSAVAAQAAEGRRLAFTYTKTRAKVEAKLRAQGERSQEELLELLYQELKVPEPKQWNEASHAHTIDELKRYVQEGRNLCLKPQQYDFPGGAKILLLDIDEDNEVVRELISSLGDLGALVFKTKRGYHALFRVENDLVIGQKKVRSVCINYFSFDVEAEVYLPDEDSKKAAERQIVVPVTGTPRVTLWDCYVMYDNGQRVDRSYTIEELVDALDRLSQTDPVIFEILQKEKDTEEKSKEAVYVETSRKEGKWKELFGEFWYRDENLITGRVVNAQVGERNNVLYHAAAALTYLGRNPNEVQDTLLKIAKKIFGPKDREALHDYKYAKTTIESGINAGKRLLENQKNHNIRSRTLAKQSIAPRSSGHVQDTTNLLAIVARFKKEEAMFYVSQQDNYILHLSNAVTLSDLPAYVLHTFGVKISEEKAKVLFTILENELPRIREKTNNAVILDTFVANITNDYLVTSYGYLELVKYLSDPGKQYDYKKRNEQVTKLKEALDELKERFGGVCNDSIEALEKSIWDLSNKFRKSYVISTSLEDVSPNLDNRNIENKDEYEVYFTMKPFGKNVLADEDRKVYIKYSSKDRLRQIPIADLIKYVVGMVPEPKDEEDKKAKASQIVEFITGVLSGFTSQIKLCNTSDFKYNLFCDYVFDLAQYHSYPTYIGEDINKLLDLDSDVSQRLHAISLLLLTLLINRGIIVITGASGSGKTTLATVLAIITNGFAASVSSLDHSNLTAAIHLLKTLLLDENRVIDKNSQGLIKQMTGGLIYLIRKYYTTDQVTSIGQKDITVIMVAVSIYGLEEDITRRGHMFRLQDYSHQETIPPQKLEEQAGFHLLFCSLLSSISKTILQKYIVSQNFGIGRKGLAKRRANTTSGAASDFIRRSNDPANAQIFYKLCQFLGIRLDIMDEVFHGTKKAFAENNLSGYWRLIWDLCKIDKEGFAVEMKSGLPANEIADRLIKHGLLEEDKRRSCMSSIGRTMDMVNAAFKQFGYQIIKEEKDDGRVTIYKIVEFSGNDNPGGGNNNPGGGDEEQLPPDLCDEPTDKYSSGPVRLDEKDLIRFVNEFYRDKKQIQFKYFDLGVPEVKTPSTDVDKIEDIKRRRFELMLEAEVFTNFWLSWRWSRPVTEEQFQNLVIEASDYIWEALRSTIPVLYQSYVQGLANRELNAPPADTPEYILSFRQTFSELLGIAFEDELQA